MANLKPDKPGTPRPAPARPPLLGIDWRQSSVISLLLANLVPVFGVLFLDWQVFTLMFLFWMENLVIGAFNVLKMLANRSSTSAGAATKYFLIPFFCVHYGFFCLMHGVIIVTIFGGGDALADFPDPAGLWRIALENKLMLALLCLVASDAITFATNYIRKGEYKRVGLNELMFRPYARIVVTQIVVILGGFGMQTLHSPTLGLLLLVFLKIFLDLRGHASESKNSQKDKVTIQ